MSLKIKIYQAGSVYEVERGCRGRYDVRDAMLCDSLFLDFMLENGLKTWKDTATRDIICLDFTYGSSSYEEAVAKYPVSELPETFDKRSKEWIREHFYQHGVDIKYATYDKSRHFSGYKTVHYKMLYRTPGKAKKGSCMFIRAGLYKKARDFLYMGIKLPRRNAPIVEIGAYSSLITSTIEARICIPPENVLILRDVDAKCLTDVISIDIDEQHRCHATRKCNYEVKNTMFDGQALIDSGTFPEWADGYILLRQHFTKCAAFCTHIQKFFHEYYGDKYETATITDMWGNKHLVKDIQMITTDNAIKWCKFGVSYEYWSEWVRANGSMWGIVKTAHKSKLGEVQRMSYQMVNALTVDIMAGVMADTVQYVSDLKNNDDLFLEYLAKNVNFSNDYEVLVALCRNDPDFVRSAYFRERKALIISNYVRNVKNGRLIQNADNLVIVGSPYAMLLHAVGEDPLSDPTFEGDQCWTGRFADGEHLAAFRSPMNSQNNIDYLHNHYHEYFDKYFSLGEQIIAVNMNGTSFQSRNNGSDQLVALHGNM